MLFRRDLPQFLEPDAEFRRFVAVAEAEAGDQRLREAAAGALGEQRIFRPQFHAAGEGILRLAILADAHIAGGDALDLAVRPVKHLGGREAGIDFDAERLGLGGEPAADLAERDDEIAVIVHQRRHHDVRQPQRPRGAEPVEAVVRHGRVDRRVFVAPFRQQPVEADRIDHRARENVGADFRALLHDDDGEVGRNLFQADRGRQAGRSCADDHDVELHTFARRQICQGHAGFLKKPCGASPRRPGARSNQLRVLPRLPPPGNATGRRHAIVALS